MIVVDPRHKTSSGFTLAELKETASYLWYVLPHNTGMQDAAGELTSQFDHLERVPVQISGEEALTVVKANLTSVLWDSSRKTMGVAYNAYDMARDRLFHMFLAMTARQYPNLVTAHMVFYMLKYQIQNGQELSLERKDVISHVVDLLDGWLHGKQKVKEPTPLLREWCLDALEKTLCKDDPETAHAYIYVLSLFH